MFVVFCVWDKNCVVCLFTFQFSMQNLIIFLTWTRNFTLFIINNHGINVVGGWGVRGGPWRGALTKRGGPWKWKGRRGTKPKNKKVTSSLWSSGLLLTYYNLGRAFHPLLGRNCLQRPLCRVPQRPLTAHSCCYWNRWDPLASAGVGFLQNKK